MASDCGLQHDQPATNAYAINAKSTPQKPTKPKSRHMESESDSEYPGVWVLARSRSLPFEGVSKNEVSL